MEIRRLKLTEIKDIYRRYVMRDFPRDERRPWPRIAAYYRRRRYEGFGGFDDAGKLVCYGLFYVYRTGGLRYCLFDYLAVLPACRDTGIGSEFLQLLGHRFPHTDCVFGEVEDPDLAQDPEERLVRERRMAFYRRNGFLETGVRARVFGVDYLLLEVPLPENVEWRTHTADEIREISEAVYHSVFPAGIYTKYCEVR